jgi:hypothetical protein
VAVMLAGSGMVFAIDDRRRRLDGNPSRRRWSFPASRLEAEPEQAASGAVVYGAVRLSATVPPGHVSAGLEASRVTYVDGTSSPRNFRHCGPLPTTMNLPKQPMLPFHPIGSLELGASSPLCTAGSPAET